MKSDADLGTRTNAHVVHYSSGITSWASAARAASSVGASRITLLFADTIIEDRDNYRFLIESAADVFGIPLPEVRYLSGKAEALTDLRGGTPTDRAAMVKARKKELADLRQKTMSQIPGLVWLSEGRTPWEVFHDERYVGNSRVDPCSKILKRKLLDRWVSENCGYGTIHYLGLDWAEPGRRERFSAAFSPRLTAFPMAEQPWLAKSMVLQLARDRGITPPRLYSFGFKHANCGGWCCKFGQSQAKRLLDWLYDYYLFCEQEEQALREFLGKDVACLRDRSSGESKALPLRVLRQRIESGDQCDMSDLGACHCFEPDENEVAA